MCECNTSCTSTAVFGDNLLASFEHFRFNIGSLIVELDPMLELLPVSRPFSPWLTSWVAARHDVCLQPHQAITIEAPLLLWLCFAFNLSPLQEAALAHLLALALEKHHILILRKKLFDQMKHGRRL